MTKNNTNEHVLFNGENIMTIHNAIRCNNCYRIFDNDEELETMQDENGYFRGCPDCRTDAYLMNIEVER